MIAEVFAFLFTVEASKTQTSGTWTTGQGTGSDVDD